MRASALFAVLSFILISLTGCNPAVHTHIVKSQQPLDEGQPVTVITKEEPLPAGAELLGVVTIGESGFTNNCEYDYVVYLAQKEARAAGANLLQITNHLTPDFWSSCHQIEANMYAVSKPFPEEDDGYWNEGQPDRGDAAQEGSARDTSAADGPRNPYFDQSQLQGADGKTAQTESNFESVRLSVFGGFSRRLSPFPDGLSDQMRDYLNSLRNGFTYGADIGFHVGGGSYIGPQYTRFRTSNSMLISFDSPEDMSSSGEMRETITVQYFGLQWTNRYLMARSDNAFYLSTSFGYTSLHDSGIYPFEIEPDKFALLPYTMRGGNFGLRLEAGLDLKLSPKTSLALGFGFSTGTIYKLELDVAGSTTNIELDRNEGEGLLRMDLLTGLRWHF